MANETCTASKQKSLPKIHRQQNWQFFHASFWPKSIAQNKTCKRLLDFPATHLLYICIKSLRNSLQLWKIFLICRSLNWTRFGRHWNLFLSNFWQLGCTLNIFKDFPNIFFFPKILLNFLIPVFMCSVICEETREAFLRCEWCLEMIFPTVFLRLPFCIILSQEPPIDTSYFNEKMLPNKWLRQINVKSCRPKFFGSLIWWHKIRHLGVVKWQWCLNPVLWVCKNSSCLNMIFFWRFHRPTILTLMVAEIWRAFKFSKDV